MMTTLSYDYSHWLGDLKSRIASARSRAALAVNAQLIGLYHSIGIDILHKQTEQAWGSKVIDRLARDLKEAFPDMKGFSSSNLKYMRYFAEHCPNLQFGQQAADQLPWFHIVTLLTKLSDDSQRAWYAEQAVLKDEDDKPTIGLLLCCKQNRLVAQYAVNGIDKPIGIAEYQLLKDLPENLAKNLPTIEALEAELEGHL